LTIFKDGYLNCKSDERFKVISEVLPKLYYPIYHLNFYPICNPPKL